MHDQYRTTGVQTTLSGQYDFGREAPNAYAPKLVQPADPLTDRIQKAISDIAQTVYATENDLDSAVGRLFGERPKQGDAAGANALPNGADEAIAQSLASLARAAHRARELAAELNGRI